MTVQTTASCEDEPESGVVSVDQALQRMLAGTTPVVGDETVALNLAVGRVLALPVEAPRPVPGHTNSAVDGYAMRGADIPASGIAELRVVGAAFAGRLGPASDIGPGEAVRIMTGAEMPPATDTVLMQEQVEVRGNVIQIDSRHRKGQNVRQAGEDMRAGDTVLAAGRWLTPADIGLLASLGETQVNVRRRLRVGVLSTGSEVCPLGRELPPGFVYDSNRYTLNAGLSRMGVRTYDLGIAPDDPAELEHRLAEAAAYTDVVVCTGGVSVGEADFVRSVLRALGEIRFWKIAMKPGRPMSFGKIGDTTFFGLPGNPVAVLVTFYWLVKPVLEQRMGILDRPLIPLVTARSEAPLRKKPGRMEFQRAVMRLDGDGEYCVVPTGKQGSGILRSMSLANALIVLSHDSGAVEPGERVRVLPLAAVV